MKNIFAREIARGLTFFFAMLVLFGCSESEPEPDLNICNVTEHQWYVDVIENAETGGTHRFSTIFRYTYQGDYFFEVTNPVFSCLSCYIYDCDGNLAAFANSAEVEDFIENRKDRVIIWSGGGL